MASKAKKGKIDKVDTARGSKKRRDWKPAFLRAFRDSANVRAACEAAGISRQRAYDARDSDRDFAAQWDESEQDAVDTLEKRAWRRSEVSDTILMFLLRAHRSEKYSERTRTENLNVDLSALNDKQLEMLANGSTLNAVLAFASAGGNGTPQTRGDAT